MTTMKELQDTLRLVYLNGTSHEGRKSYFSTQLRFDCTKSKIPDSSLRKVPLDTLLLQLMLTIHGVSQIDAYKKLNLYTDKLYPVTEKTATELINHFIERGLIHPDQAPLALSSLEHDNIGELGANTAMLWRHWPKTMRDIQRLAVVRTIDELPSNLVESLSETYQGLPEDEKAQMDLETWVLTHYYSSVDQLNELIYQLRDGAYHRPYLVSSFNPELAPLPEFSPGVNVMMGRSSVFNAQFAFQCFLQPPVLEGGQKQLSLKIYLTSADLFNELPAFMSQYGIFLHLLAQVTDTAPHTLVIDIGEAYYSLKDQNAITSYLSTAPEEPSPTITIHSHSNELFTIDPTEVSFQSASTEEKKHD